MPLRRAVATVVVGALAVVTGSCRDSGNDAARRPAAPASIDTEEVERLIVDTQRKASPDFNVGAASCPEHVAVSTGGSFQCTVMVDGVVAPYTVTPENVNTQTKTGTFNVRPAKAILSVPKLVDSVKRLATDPAAKVDCGPSRVLVLDAGTTVDCQLTDNQGTHTVTLRVEDTQGKVRVIGVR